MYLYDMIFFSAFLRTLATKNDILDLKRELVKKIHRLSKSSNNNEESEPQEESGLSFPMKTVKDIDECNTLLETSKTALKAFVSIFFSTIFLL